jgi:hypothetical protein
VLDCALHTFAIDDNLEGLTLNCFARICQGTGNLSEPRTNCKREIC